MKKLKIKGITGSPLFLTRLRGRLDWKRGAVSQSEDGWRGHYLDEKRACCDAFVRMLQTSLEEKTAALYQESTRLSLEYSSIVEKLSGPEETPTGSTASIQLRSAGRISAARNSLESRRTEISLRLADIEETLIHAAIDVAAQQEEAIALTHKRMDAYLHGASLASGAICRNPQTNPLVPVEEIFRTRHHDSDMLRQNILKKGVALQ